MTKQWLKLCHNIKRNALIPFWQNNKSKIKSGNRSGHTQSKIDSSHRKWCRIYSIKYVIICIRFEAHLLFVDVMGFVIVVLLFLYNVHGLCSTNKHTHRDKKNELRTKRQNGIASIKWTEKEQTHIHGVFCFHCALVIITMPKSYLIEIISSVFILYLALIQSRY